MDLRRIKHELESRISILKKQREHIDRLTEVLENRVKRVLYAAEKYSNRTGDNSPERRLVSLIKTRNVRTARTTRNGDVYRKRLLEMLKKRNTNNSDVYRKRLSEMIKLKKYKSRRNIFDNSNNN
jgi:hypothetical protein